MGVCPTQVLYLSIMKISELVAAITHFAAPELQEPYDNAALLTGNGQWDCTGILCTLDVTEDTIDEAVRSKCNLIVAHHPVIFKALKQLTGKNYVERIIIKAIKLDVAIYAAHTNLDNVLLGVSGKMASLLQLKDIAVLQPKAKILRRLITFAPDDKAEQVREAVFKAGAGHIGNYDECSFNSKGTGTFRAGEGADPYVGEVGRRHEEKETKIEIVYPFFLETQVVKALVENHPYEEVAYDIFEMQNIHLGIGAGVVGTLEQPVSEKDFLKMVKETFKAEVIRHTAFTGKSIKKVALCGGAGSFLIKDAQRVKADAFLTADMKYHEFFDADGQILVADIGHYESEQFTIDLLHDLLLQKFPTFAVFKTGIITNPVQYFI